jgi:hypothetical protein
VGDRILLEPGLAPALAAAGLASVDALLALNGPPDAPHVVTEVHVDVAGTCGHFHLKRYHYAGWARSRGLVGRGSLWGRAPEMNEFRALSRLREMGIPAVRPVAAASRTRRGRLVAHALLTEHTPNATDLATRLRDADDPLSLEPPLRRRVLDRIGHHLGRMHAEGFVHRDCHARNILVRLPARADPRADAVGDDGEVRIFFLDCRRGGNASLRKGPLYDLATLDADLLGLVPASDRLRLLTAWLPEGESPRKTYARVRRLRARIVSRDARRGRTRR